MSERPRLIEQPMCFANVARTVQAEEPPIGDGEEGLRVASIGTLLHQLHRLLPLSGSCELVRFVKEIHGGTLPP